MLTPVHAALPPPGWGPALLVRLVLAGVGSAIPLGLAVAAFARRRIRSHLLVALALAALVARTGVGDGGGGGRGAVAVPSPKRHHTIEHALDVVMAALVIGAVLHARNAYPETGDRT